MSRKPAIRYPYAKLYVRLSKALAVLVSLLPLFLVYAAFQESGGDLIQQIKQQPTAHLKLFMTWFGGSWLAAFFLLVIADFLSCFLQIEDNTGAAAGLLQKLVRQFEAENRSA